MTISLDKLTRRKTHNPDLECYLLDEIKGLPGEVIELTSVQYLWVYDNDGHVEFALLNFISSQGDDSEIYVDYVFRGYGFSGALREMRHVWWGDKDGYTYYLPAGAVIKAFEYLSKYFDLEP